MLESERDQRVWQYICERVGEQSALEACASLAGERRAYVSIVAKALGLTVPQQQKRASQETARAHLDRMVTMLGMRRRDP